MRNILVLGAHLLVTLAKLLRTGGVRAVAAESLLLKHQLWTSNRSRKRAPNLMTLDRFVLGLTTLFVSRRRISSLGTYIKPATLFHFPKALARRTNRMGPRSSDECWNHPGTEFMPPFYRQPSLVFLGPQAWRIDKEPYAS
jgi:hypothetical protein